MYLADFNNDSQLGWTRRDSFEIQLSYTPSRDDIVIARLGTLARIQVCRLGKAFE